MRGSLAIACVVAACGGSAPVAAPPAPPVAATPAPVTCADAAVILRGSVMDHREAGPAKDGTIATVCARDAWAAELMACIGTESSPRRCLQKLSPEQWKSFDAALIAWNEQFPDETLEGQGTDDPADHEYIDCSAAILDASAYAPALSPPGDDHAFHVGMRQRVIEAACESWETAERACFREATTTPEVDACRAQLDPADEQLLLLKIASVDKLFALVASLKKKPAAIECTKVAAAHYADPMWAARAPVLQGAERKRAITDSRAQLAKSCARDAWSPTLRACIVASGSESDECLTPEQRLAWDYPARGIFVKTGIAECDAYTKALKAVPSCGLPALARFESMGATLQRGILTTQTSPEWRKHVGSECARLDGDLRQIAARSGCKL